MGLNQVLISVSSVFSVAELGLKGNGHESAGIGEENLPQLQDRPPQAGGAGDLQESAPQAAPGLIRYEDYV